MDIIKKGLILVVLIAVGLLVFSFLDKANYQEKNNNEKVNNETEINMSDSNKIAILKTNMGNIKIELLSADAPKTVENFVKLTEDGFYDGTRFHRIIKDFMIQGGDPLSKDDSKRQFWGTGGPGYVFEDEPNGVELVQGTLAMANAGPDTNGSQFFIITAESTPWLQGAHTGFGRVIEGLDIVLEIGNVQTAAGDQPVEDVVLEKVIIE